MTIGGNAEVIDNMALQLNQTSSAVGQISVNTDLL